MTEFIDNLLSDVEIDLQTSIFRLIMSLMIGIIIGAERQIRRRDAGLRTFTLICVGSTGAMLISIWIPQTYPNFLNGDPGRIAAQVLTGIGFLGAGAIMRGKGSVQGLTTAACIWQTSVIGLAVGAGLYSCALVATALTIFLLVTVERFERRLFIDGANRILVIRCSSSTPDFDELRKTILMSHIVINSFTFSVDYEKESSSITYKVTVKTNAPHLELCKNLKTCKSVTSFNLME
ncbi:MAG: MgtC/SapB family protein [Bacteroidales bacterium]|nr:MgtC/SapB family protein [Bacteroidales bacterium]